jgi:hypothetical protein
MFATSHAPGYRTLVSCHAAARRSNPQGLLALTYGRGSDDWPEIVCAENIKKYYEPDTDVPTAAKPGLQGRAILRLLA